MNKKSVCFVLILIVIFSTSLMGFILQTTELQKAFPNEEAGFGCWIKLNEPINLEKVAESLEGIIELGENYIYGWLHISRWNTASVSGWNEIRSLQSRVFVYADLEGYLVTFLNKEVPAAGIIDFKNVNFRTGTIVDFTITETIYLILNSLGFRKENVSSRINYADFQNPTANKFLIILADANDKNEYVHVAIPEKLEILSYSYRFSVTAYTTGSSRQHGRLSINGVNRISTSDNFGSARTNPVDLWNTSIRETSNFDPYAANTFLLIPQSTSKPLLAIIIVYREY